MCLILDIAPKIRVLVYDVDVSVHRGPVLLDVVFFISSRFLWSVAADVLPQVGCEPRLARAGGARDPDDEWRHLAVIGLEPLKLLIN